MFEASSLHFKVQNLPVNLHEKEKVLAEYAGMLKKKPKNMNIVHNSIFFSRNGIKQAG